MNHTIPSRWDHLGLVATALSIFACYGTLLAVSALSALGISLAVHAGAWAGAISLFALLAVAGLAVGYRRHRHAAPLVLGGVALGIILWVMFGEYSRPLEIFAFALLVAAVARDWKARTLRSYSMQ
ncbi:MAG: MerC domain-containing protein [Gammaproteobacteria bacterium]|jgi:nicotinamide riboside transporter PnuC|nr:MerC domain-containing protein [Gammaproteobacteria bacterium]